LSRLPTGGVWAAGHPEALDPPPPGGAQAPQGAQGHHSAGAV